MTGPKGNGEFCFPGTLNVPRGEVEMNIKVKGEQNSLFPKDQLLGVLLYHSLETSIKFQEIVCLIPADT